MNAETFEQMHLTGRDYWWYQAKEQLMELLLQRISPGPVPPDGYNILDIGCGTGTMFGFLAEHGRVIGLEPSSRATEYAVSRHIAQLVRADASKAPFTAESFDIISMFDSLEHMEDDYGALVNARRMIRPDGTLLATAPAFQWLRSWRETQLGHRRRYTVNTLGKLIKTAGFRIHFISYMYAGLFPVLVLKSLKDRIVPPPRTFKSDIVMLPEPWNGMLAKWFIKEASFCNRFGLPLGTSVVCVAKPETTHEPIDRNSKDTKL
ncbi:class I SAM-dependent methyltransferase [bacterium]|nr:class I SAM-dependent methyltransferase [bacterium]